MHARARSIDELIKGHVSRKIKGNIKVFKSYGLIDARSKKFMARVEYLNAGEVP